MERDRGTAGGRPFSSLSLRWGEDVRLRDGERRGGEGRGGRRDSEKVKKTEGREGKEMVKMGDGDEEGKVREWREAKGIKVRRGEERRGEEGGCEGSE